MFFRRIYLRKEGTRYLPNLLNRRPERSGDSKLARHPFNTVGGIDVLDENDLIASSTTLTGNDGRPGEEDLPDLKAR